MKCPSCQIENDDTRRFCRECGARLLVTCPVCSAENSPGDKFCGECGRPIDLVCSSVRDMTFDEKISRIQKYLPHGLIEKILSQRERIEGEKKQVTVMFCDMEKFTTISEKIGPEGVYMLMDQVYELLIHKVHDFGGTVNEFTGDGIMALFGAPIALEDGPQRAIRAALDIQTEISRFSERIENETRHSPIRLRIGIHSGPVVVGSLGNDLRVEFKAVGDTVNLASRVQDLAEPGTVFVTESTFKLTKGMFRFEALGEKVFKGKSAPVGVYQVIAKNTRRTRFDVCAEFGLTPFVGRNRELELLIGAFYMAKAGFGQAFSIIGEAGIGKSRLLYQFRKVVANADITFLDGKCLSYSKGVAYHPMIDLLKSSFDIREDDDDRMIHKKVRNALRLLKVDSVTTMPYLLDLLSVKDSGIEAIPMSPESRKEKIVEAVKQVILKGAQIRPLVIAIEDLHWADQATKEALKRLVEAIPAAAVLLIFTYRPEFVQTWAGRSFHNLVNLSRLTNAESLLMISYLLGTSSVDQTLKQLILDKSAGIPFFLEEFIDSLKDLNLIVKEDDFAYFRGDSQSVAVPSTIQDMIMAKVDRLPGAVKSVLQAAASIDKEFPYALIKRVAEFGETELLECLDILKESELLYERYLLPGNVYFFRHAMTRDVVYDSILKKTRKRLNESIGNAIEKLYKDKLEDHYGSLINHFSASENFLKVSHYARLACIKADNSLNLSDASIYARKWINSLEQLSKMQMLSEEIIKARTVLGFILFRMGNMAIAMEAIEPFANKLLPKKMSVEQGQIWVITGSYKCMVEEEVFESIRYLEMAIGISEKTEDIITAVYAQYMLGLVLAFNCDFQKALHYFELLLGYSEALAYAWRTSVMKSNLSIYGYTYHGRVADGYRCSQDAVCIAEESGDIYSKAMAYPSHGVSCYYKGFFKEAQQNLQKGIEYTEKLNLTAHSALAHEYMGHVCVQQQNYKVAQMHYEQAICIREKSRLFPSSANLNRIALARARCLSGEKMTNFDSLCRFESKNRIRIYEGSVARYLADIILNEDEKAICRAEIWINKAIQSNTRNEMKCNLGWDYALYGEYFVKTKKPSRAKDCLEQAVSIFQVCGADGWADLTSKRLSEVCA